MNNHEEIYIEDCYKVADDDILFRYMDFGKFKRIINESAIWFANSDSFLDKTEGEIPEAFFKNWKETQSQTYDVINEFKNKIYQKYISCWCKHKFELETMWLSYGGNVNDGGLCIKTTVAKLRKVIKNQNAEIYKVKYLNFNDKDAERPNPPFIYRDNGGEITDRLRIFHTLKQRNYTDEREVRAIIISHIYDKPEKGIAVPFSPSDFIDEIIINPHSNEEQKREIIAFLKEKGLFNKLVESEINYRNKG